jgi:hypothetical protein
VRKKGKCVKKRKARKARKSAARSINGGRGR